MSVYLLNCSVCKEQFSRSQDWLKHLTRGNHQDLARREWNTENNVRECCLVVFTTYSLTRQGADKVIEYFSNWKTFVTDFVWWGDRSRVAILQFESRAKVEDVINALYGSSELQIDDERVQVKGAFDLLELEWRALLPGDNERPSPSTSREAQSTLEAKKRKRESDESSSETFKSTKSCEGETQVAGLTSKRRKGIRSSPKNVPQLPKNHDASILSTAVDKLPASIEPCSPDSLRHQFWLIRQSIVIPDSEYNEAVKIVDSLNKLLQESFASNRVVMFRNWHLKLRNPMKSPDEGHLQIYAYNDWAPPEFPCSHSWISDHVVFRIFSDPKVQEKFEVVFEKPHPSYQVKYKSSAIPVRLFTYTGIMIEVQVCRLLKYLCLFDPRCHPLLTLVHYWSYMNDVPFFTKELPGRTHVSLPTPLNLQWLVIHFMCYRKYIPTVREIQERPHQVLLDRLSGTDVGFFADLEYVREWSSMKQNLVVYDNEDYSSEKFVLTVVQLFQEFCNFCGQTLDSGDYILNTRDGEIIDINQFLTSEPGYGWTTKMTTQEIVEIRTLQRYSKKLSTNKNDNFESGDSETQRTCKQYFTDFGNWKVYMIHPFKFSWKFSIPSGKVVREVWACMNETENKLKRYLKMRKHNGAAQARQVFGDLRNVLTIDGNEIQEPLQS